MTFWRVTLPHLRPALGGGSLLVALYALRDFGAVSIMRYDTFTRIIYVQYRSFDRSQAALLALVLVALTLVLVALEARTHGRARYCQAGPAHPPARTGAAGRLALAGVALLCGGCVCELVLPAGVLVYLAGCAAWRREKCIPALGLAAWNSVLASGLGALATVLGGLPVAILAVRRSGRLTRLMERLAYTMFALPGIVVALALVFFGANYAAALYQTLPMLLLAYGFCFCRRRSGRCAQHSYRSTPAWKKPPAAWDAGPARCFEHHLSADAAGTGGGRQPGLSDSDEGTAGDIDPGSHRVQDPGHRRLVGGLGGFFRAGRSPGPADHFDVVAADDFLYPARTKS